jgi:hypothetical protein
VTDPSVFGPVFALIEDYGLFDAIRNKALHLLRMDKVHPHV